MQDHQLTQYDSSAETLTATLRERLHDDDYMVRAFTVKLSSGSARSSDIVVQNGMLVSTVMGGGSARSFQVSLDGIDTDTVGGVFEFIQRQEGYSASGDEAMNRSHPASDLIVKGHGSLTRGVHFYHRRWSDAELLSILSHAASRHNMNYSIHNVPRNEYGFVITLALAEANRMLAQDGVKLKGLSVDAQTCIDLAESFEKQYERDRRRQERLIPVGKMKDSNVEGGDIVQGRTWRRSLRTGLIAPLSVQRGPEVPELFIPNEEDVEDTQIRISWRRVREQDFGMMELWRDTRPDVRRTHLGNATGPNDNSNVGFPTTSKLVYSPRWSTIPNWPHRGIQYNRFGLPPNQNVNEYVDGAIYNQSTWGPTGGPTNAPPVEPETTYYYVLYVFDLNGLAIGSNTIEATTKRIRAKFARKEETADTPLEPTAGPIAGGTACTIRGTGFHEGMRVRLGDKEVLNLTVVSAEEATFTTPAVQNRAILNLNALDLVIISDTGLEDVLYRSWGYTA